MAAARVRRTSVLERGPDGSVINCSELSGGLRVVTESVPGARSVSVGVWVGVGSVDETPRLAGASHYLEHLLFKGTRFRTGYDIAAAVDAVGGELNAFTAHEYTCFYARMLSDEAQLAVSLVCEVVLDATIAGADVDTERSVILVEHKMKLVMGICERLVVLDFGVTIAAGTPERVRNDPKVIEAYLKPPEDD